MHLPSSSHSLLPHPLPAQADARLLLFGIRRMAAAGLGDAHAASAFVLAFGVGYRRPLMLVRALMAELCRVASVRLTVAPCCCGMMSTDEHALMTVVTLADSDPPAAHDRLRAILHVHHCYGATDSARAVATCFADLGRPLSDPQLHQVQLRSTV